MARRGKGQRVDGYGKAREGELTIGDICKHKTCQPPVIPLARNHAVLTTPLNSPLTCRHTSNQHPSIASNLPPTLTFSSLTICANVFHADVCWCAKSRAGDCIRTCACEGRVSREEPDRRARRDADSAGTRSRTGEMVSKYTLMVSNGCPQRREVTPGQEGGSEHMRRERRSRRRRRRLGAKCVEAASSPAVVPAMKSTSGGGGSVCIGSSRTVMSELACGGKLRLACGGRAARVGQRGDQLCQTNVSKVEIRAQGVAICYTAKARLSCEQKSGSAVPELSRTSPVSRISAG